MIRPCIFYDQINSLIYIPLEAEIWEVVNNIGALKALRQDGVHASFYQNCWETVGTSVCNIVKDFFANNSSIRLINHTNIVLIPKVDNPEIVSNYRPISICNVSYKIITKIIITSLKPLLNACISPNQGAFALCRSIQDNILIAYELFSGFNGKKGRTRVMVLKLDLEKAYDLLNWDYIRCLLTNFGFSVTWVNLVMECISSMSFSVNINGDSHGYFFPSRGIRHGDHLSPFIFILYMEPLIRSPNELACKPKSNVGVLTSPFRSKVSNLVFADDSLIFAKATLGVIGMFFKY